jgi:putative membrane protein
MMAFVIPNALVAVFRYMTYRYRYDASEMVIRSGLIFRKERHIPYARIQNVDAVQNLLHRLLNVVEVRLETGGGQTAEATMSVLPLPAFHEMRDRVGVERHAAAATRTAAAEDTTGEATAAARAAGTTPILTLDTRELVLCGFLENRGAILITAGFGVVWELGLLDRWAGQAFRGRGGGRVMRDLIRTTISDTDVAFGRIALTIGAFIGLLILVRLLSMVWALTRLYGFRLVRVNEELRSEYGLLTHVTATIPLRRIQTLSIVEGPLYRLFGRVVVHADTAGGRPKEGEKTTRESLAPILRRDRLPAFVRQLLGDRVDLERIAWNPVAPGAFRREVKGWLFTALIIVALAAGAVGWRALALAPFTIAWAIVAARRTVRHLGWAVTEDAALMRRGWLWRRVNIVPLVKIQGVALLETPFDRRTRMARLRVDAAGASEATRVAVPYLERPVAVGAHARLAAAAATTEFKW